MGSHEVSHIINDYRRQIKELQKALKIERRNFNLLEKSVDQSHDGDEIYKKYHKLREEDVIE